MSIRISLVIDFIHTQLCQILLVKEMKTCVGMCESFILFGTDVMQISTYFYYKYRIYVIQKNMNLLHCYKH